VRIGVEFEANVTTKSHTAYSVESWLLGRDATAKSKPPNASKTFPCPNCGAPWKASDTGTQVCASCGQAVDNGRFDWVVEQISLASIDQRPPTLTTDVPERGNDLPTYRQPDIHERFAARHGAGRGFDLALLPIGAYEPRWFMSAQHMNPGEAVKAFAHSGAELALGHHYGTFQLTDEPIDAPATALAEARAAAGLSPERFLLLRPGEVWEL